MCLLDVLVLLSRKYAFTLHIAHINYHLRGRASDLDEALTKSLAVRYHLPYTVFSQRKKLASDAEEVLRDIRYAFLEKLREKIGARHIAVAHNQNDQAETLLLRLLRGAGLAGLAAMRPQNEQIIRPLIEISRVDIVRYLKERDIAFREDESNRDQRYLRNRVRHTLIPFLEKNFQPQVLKLLASTALTLGEDYAMLEKYPTTFAVKRNSDDVEFSRSALLKLPTALLCRELRALLKPYLSGKNPTKNLIHELIKALQSEKSKNQTLTFQKLKFVRKGDTVRLFRF